VKTILDTAREYVAGDISVIPVRADGSKAPKLPGWRAYAERRPTAAELSAWFGSDSNVGIGIPCGPASGNLAVLDFESAEVWRKWYATIPADTADILDGCPIVRTPSGGAHVWCRLPDPVPGTVLARTHDKGTLIEVRGEGHQVIAPGSPAACHPIGKPYTFEQRGFLDVPGERGEVPFEVWFAWIDHAARLNEYTPPTLPKPAPLPARDRTDDDPGSDFNARGSWDATGLFSAGWQWARQLESERGFIRRPGKGDGISATVGLIVSKKASTPLLYVFTSNAPPLEQGQCYDKFGTFARLNHGGDFKAAARALATAGYGKPMSKGNTVATPKATMAIPTAASVKTESTTTAKTGVEIIREYFAERYKPVFRTASGNGIHCEDGEEVVQAVACSAASSKLIALLAMAEDAPRYPNGGIKTGSLPGFFKKWAATAWTDLRDSLPTEDEAELGSDAPAREAFRGMVRAALLSLQCLGGKDENGVRDFEKASLIEWAKRFAKLNRWAGIRSYPLWSKQRHEGKAIITMVAFTHDLLAQIGAEKALVKMGPSRFARLAKKYGVGEANRNERPQGKWAIVLTDEFTAEILPPDRVARDEPESKTESAPAPMLF
jgi:hypothetical protein